MFSFLGDDEDDEIEDGQQLCEGGTTTTGTGRTGAQQPGGRKGNKRLSFCVGDVRLSNQSLDEVDIETLLAAYVENELKECFNSFDVVGKKEITCQQMQSAFEAFNIVVDMDECEEIVAAFDVSQTGKITWADFQRNMHDVIGSGTTETHIRMVFDMMDINGDGTIGADEISTQFKKLGFFISNEEALMYMSKIDKKEQGFITYEMFSEFCNSTDMVQSLWRESISRMEEED